jgi:hypothetical protein
MIVVAGGSLSIEGVEIELEMPRKIPAATWTLFEVLRAQRLRLERTTLSIRNSGDQQAAFHPSVAFFDLKTPPGSETMGTAGTAPARTVIELTDCVLRGEATCLRTSEFEPVQLVWNNGLLATSESLLSARGEAGRPRPSSGVEIELRHVTAVVLGGLARLANSDDLPYLFNTSIALDSCAIATDPQSPLIEQRGIDSVNQFRDQLKWSAKNVDFEGTAVFWRVTNTVSNDTTDLDFATWENYWGTKSETECRRGTLPWLGDGVAKKRLGDLTPSDLDHPPLR